MVNVLAVGEGPAIPGWSATLFALAAAWWLGFFIAAVRTKELRVERRRYWLGYGGVAVLTGLGLCFQGWQAGVTATGFVMLYTTLYAALKTPYLKVGDRLITASASDRRRDEQDRGIAPREPTPDFYATSSPAQLWWAVAILAAMAAVGVLMPDDDWRTWIGPVIVVLYAPCVGLLDGRGRFPVARRQWVPATVAGVASIALYGVPIVLYAAGYFAGRRLPVGRAQGDDTAVRKSDHDPDGGACKPSQDVSRSG